MTCDLCHGEKKIKSDVRCPRCTKEKIDMSLDENSKLLVAILAGFLLIFGMVHSCNSIPPNQTLMQQCASICKDKDIYWSDRLDGYYEGKLDPKPGTFHDPVPAKCLCVKTGTKPNEP